MLSEFTDVGGLLRTAPIIVVVTTLSVFLLLFSISFLKMQRAMPFLNKSVQQLRLIDKVPLTHDSFRLRFELPSKNYYLGLPTGKHVKILIPNKFIAANEGHWNGQPDRDVGRLHIERKYTPISGDDFLGLVDFVVKEYKPSERFCDGGKGSQYICALKLGDVIEVTGPIGLVTYHGHGRFTRGPTEYRCTQVGMIAGGTGLTPILRVIRHILSDSTDTTKVFLLFANRTEEDILMRDELDEMQALHPDQLRVWYTVDRLVSGAFSKWKYSQGHINEEMLRDHMPPPGDDTLILMCGPRGMVDEACGPNLERLGFAPSRCLTF